MDKFIAYLKEGGQLLVKAPFLAVPIFAAGMLLGWFWNRERLDDAHERVALLDARVVAKDLDVAKYRQRVEQIEAAVTGMAKLTDKELAHKATQIAAGMRGLANDYDTRTAERLMIATIAPMPADRDAAARAIEERWKTDNLVIARESTVLMQSYDAKFKADAMTARDEMVSRIPPSRLQGRDEKHINGMYSWGAFIGIREAIADLEMLARKLPGL